MTLLVPPNYSDSDWQPFLCPLISLFQSVLVNCWNADLVVKAKGRRESAKCSRWWFPPLENYTQPASVHGRWLMKSSLFGNKDLRVWCIREKIEIHEDWKALEIATSDGCKDDPIRMMVMKMPFDEDDIDDDQSWCLKQGGIRWRGRAWCCTCGTN